MEVSDEAALAARRQAGRLVREYGDKYLPIFDAIDAWVEARYAQRNQLERAIRIASE